MTRLNWLAKMTLGSLCYWLLEIPGMWESRARDALLPWAGFYAYDTGYADWVRRDNKELTGAHDETNKNRDA